VAATVPPTARYGPLRGRSCSSRSTAGHAETAAATHLEEIAPADNASVVLLVIDCLHPIVEPGLPCHTIRHLCFTLVRVLDH
jgi:hypothetical protein